MSKYLLWYCLVFLQIIAALYFILVAYIGIESDFLAELFPILFILYFSISAGLSFILTYNYYYYKNNIAVINKKLFLMFIGFALGYMSFMIFFVLLIGNLLAVLSIGWFLFTIIYLGFKYVFKKQEDLITSP